MIEKLKLEELAADEEFMRELERWGYKLEDFTCAGCNESETCPFAFDLYNTQGDCLREK